MITKNKPLRNSGILDLYIDFGVTKSTNNFLFKKTCTATNKKALIPELTNELFNVSRLKLPIKSPRNLDVKIYPVAFTQKPRNKKLFKSTKNAEIGLIKPIIKREKKEIEKNI